jgi:hypothetical protein
MFKYHSTIPYTPPMTVIQSYHGYPELVNGDAWLSGLLFVGKMLIWCKGEIGIMWSICIMQLVIYSLTTHPQTNSLQSEVNIFCLHLQVCLTCKQWQILTWIQHWIHWEFWSHFLRIRKNNIKYVTYHTLDKWQHYNEELSHHHIWHVHHAE